MYARDLEQQGSRYHAGAEDAVRRRLRYSAVARFWSLV